MIKNLSEYMITSSTLNEFEKRKSFLENQPPTDKTTLEINGLVAIINDLSEQIYQFERIKNGIITFKSLEKFQDLPTIFIGKRIQLDISQEEMAEKLGLVPFQYISLENNDFYGIDTKLFTNILKILRINNPNQILTKDYKTLIPIIEDNLKELDKSSTFMSSTIKSTKESFKKKSALTNYYIEKIIEQFKEFFFIDIQEKITPSKMNSSLAVAFKHKTNIKESSLNLSTAYAAYTARVIVKQMKPSTKYKADPITIRKEILKTYKSVTLDSCLDFIWKLNIAVIPLNMHGSFHGACLDFDETKAIILSQQNKCVSRWKFDLLHELYHALVMDYSIYIERTDIMYQDDQEEKKASEFASHVIFGQEMESVLALILEQSGGHMDLVKKVTVSIAKEFNINIDDLANYVAFRISKRPYSFWGAAMNLQTDLRNPVDIVLDHLSKEIQSVNLSSFEFDIMQTIFNQEVISLG